MKTKISLKNFHIFSFSFLFLIVFTGLYYQYCAANTIAIKNFEKDNYNTSLEIREKIRLIFDRIQYDFIQKNQQNSEKLDALSELYNMHKEDFNATEIAEALNKDVTVGRYEVFLINKKYCIEKASYAKDLGLDFTPFKRITDLFESLFTKKIMMDISSVKTNFGSMPLKKYLVKLSDDEKYILQLAYSLDYGELLRNQLQYFLINDETINLYMATEFTIQKLNLKSNLLDEKTLEQDWKTTRKYLSDINQALKNQKLEALLDVDVKKENINLNHELLKLVPVNEKLVSYLDTSTNRINFFSITDSLFGDSSETILFIETAFSLNSLNAHLKKNLNTFIMISFAVFIILLGLKYLIKREITSKIIFITNKIQHHEVIENGHAKIEEICILIDSYNQMLNNLNTQIRINKELSYIDALTEIKNRKAYDEAIQELIIFYQRYMTTFSIAILDIDDFKKINDTYGHGVGDIVLKEIAKILKSSIRISDKVYRIGGEEFVIIFPNTPLNESATVVEEIRKKIQYNLIINETITITLSVGITEIQDGDSEDSIFKRMDTFLYHSKRNGKNKVTSH